MEVEFLDLGPGLRECEPQLSLALDRVRQSGRFVLGPEVEAFEREFAAACGTGHCVGVGSGLAALELTLRAWGIGFGDEVLVPAYTAMATWMAVAATGARPVGIDIDPISRALSSDLIEAAVTAHTRAVVPVHLFGAPADMDAVNAVAGRHGLKVLEDAAHAHGARFRGRPVGSLGSAGAFSFYPTKNLGALGDGGAVTTDDPELAERLRALRGPGGTRAAGEPNPEGHSSRLDEIQAAVLRVKLRRLEEWNERRVRLAQRYRELLGDTEGVSLPSMPDEADHVWHLFVLAVENREWWRDRLAASGVSALVHYDPPPHRTARFRGTGHQQDAFPAAERLSARALSLPLHPHLPPQAIDHVARQVIGARPAAASGRLAASR